MGGPHQRGAYPHTEPWARIKAPCSQTVIYRPCSLFTTPSAQLSLSSVVLPCPPVSGFTDHLRFEVLPQKDVVIVLTKRLRYLDRDGAVWTVPSGFRCDLASVPKWLRSLSTGWNQSARAGVFHDCLYRWFEIWEVPRRPADAMYMQALRDDGVPRWRARLQNWGLLALAPRRAWNTYRQTHPSRKGIKPEPPRATS